MDAYLAGHPNWAPRKVGMVVAVARTFIRWAASERVPVPDFARGLRQHGSAPSSEPAMTADELRAVLDAAKGHALEVPIHLAALAGLSLGDLRSLDWAEVDLDAGWIVRPRGRQKTGVPLRVPILPRLAEALKPGRATAGRVVTLPAYDDGYTSLKRLFVRCGVRTRGGWHALRAGFGTLLGETGAQQAVIGRALSHRPGSAVTGRYVRPDDAALLAAMRRAGERLGGA